MIFLGEAFLLSGEALLLPGPGELCLSLSLQLRGGDGESSAQLLRGGLASLLGGVSALFQSLLGGVSPLLPPH